MGVRSILDVKEYGGVDSVLFNGSVSIEDIKSEDIESIIIEKNTRLEFSFEKSLNTGKV